MMEITQKAPTVMIMMIMMSFIIIIITVVDNVGFLMVDGAPWEAAAISGEEEGENNEGLVLEKFRSLLGLTSFHKIKQSNGYYSPAPSPSEAEAPGPARAPTPGPMAHLHHRHHQPQPRPMFALHKFDDHKRVNAKKKIIITGVAVSIGIASVLCALGILLLWAFSRRQNKHKKRATVVASLCDDDKFINASPGFALVLEHKCINASPVENKSCELDVSKEQCDFTERHSSSAEEIISVREYAESCKYESDGQNSPNCDNSDGNHLHLSEDESFHSLIDSRSSSNRRLSNVSLCSFGDPLEVFSPDQINKSPISSKIMNTQSFVNLSSKHPPHPPPPPPPPHSKTTKTTSQSSNSPKILEVQSNTPPPPPFLNGNGNSFKGPPPPPGKPFLSTPMGKDGAPLPKLKPLHWDKVRAAPDRSMVWDQLRCSSFEFDEQMIESLFGYSLKTAFNDETKSKPPSPSKHVLEPKRLQNITILSKALNASAEKVCEALVQGEGLCTQQLEALIKMAPTKEEEVKLSDYIGDINELGSAEKLVKQMLRIPYVFQRIEAMLYRATFEDEVVHLRNSFSMLEEACKELRSSRLFLKLLEAVLKTGNRMNVGTIRGGAKAFKLDALLKLADVKGTDGKTTLLHFVVQEIIRSEGIRMSHSIMGQIERSNKSRTIEEQEEDYRRMGLDLVSGLSNELCNVKRTASIDLEVLATSVSNLSEGMSKLQKLVSKDMCTDATNDNFVHAMMTFLSHAEKNLKELQAEEDKVLLSVREITEYYHGNVSKDEKNPLWIYVIVSEFLVMLDQVCRELKSLKTPKTPNPLAPFR